MKRKIIALSTALLLPAATLAFILNVKPDKTVAKASTTVTAGSSLPTTIDLNDTSDSDIRSYYSSLNSLSTSERQGTNLLKNLRNIIHNLTYYSYDNCWKIYEITDREWSLSPAASDSSNNITYNSSTNKFTKYTYGTSTSSTGSNPYVHTLYRNRDSNGVTLTNARIREWDAHSSSSYAESSAPSGMTNREHVWCQSRGFKASSGATGPAGTDVHHLMSGDGYVNQSVHNNNPYGNVSSIETNAANKVSWLSGNLLGKPSYSNVSSSTTNVFEPQDCDKGDIARAIFYMAACYNNYSGSETISSFDPYLAIEDDLYTDDTVTSSSSTPATMGILHDLLEWHEQDPVDEFEIHRNNLIYTNYQHNRNPFIDFPEWVECVWGTSSSVNTVSGYATPSSDTINGYNTGGSVSISSDTATVNVGSTTTLSATSSDSSTITWSTSNSSIAKISKTSASSGSSITVTGVAAGTATITARATIDGTTYSKTCTVTVKDTSVTLSSISVSGQTTSYTVGDTFSFDGTCTATYSDSSTATVTPTSVSIPDMSTTGTKNVTVSYTENSVTKTTSYSITVNEDTGATLYSGDLVEGDYVIYYNGKAMNNTVSSNRLQYSEVTPSNNSIASPDASIVWHIAPSGDYWTIYNSSVEKYASATGTKNQAQLLSDGTDDKALWSVSGTSTYDFTNKANAASNINRTLRNNGTYGFACYSTSTGGALSLYKLAEGSSISTDTITLDKSTLTLTVGNSETITATATGTVTWKSSDESVATVTNGVVTAVGGGSATITATCGTVTATCTVNVTEVYNYDISFKAASSDSGTAYSSPSADDIVTSGSDYIASIDTATKLYTGIHGMKFGTGSEVGDFAFTASSSLQALNIDAITIYCAQFGSDSGTLDLYVNGGTTSVKSITPSSGSDTYTFSSATTITSLEIKTSEKRAYLKGIDFSISSASSVAVTGVSLDQTALSVIAGGTATLTATVAPANATNKTVTWSSSNSNVATVANGVVTGVAAGSATITATTKDGGYTATCSVTVTAAPEHTGTLTIDPTNFNSLTGVTCSSGVTENTSYSNEFTVTKNSAGNILISGYYTGITQVVLSIYGKYNNMEVYSGTSASGTAVSASSSDYSNYTTTATYTFNSIDSVYLVNTSTEYDQQLYSITVTYSSTVVWDWADSYMHMTDYTTNDGYCKDTTHAYYDNAKAALLSLGSIAINELQNDSQYADVLARYNAWATANNDSSPFTANNANRGALNESEAIKNLYILSIIGLTASLGVVVIAAIRKRKYLIK